MRINYPVRYEVGDIVFTCIGSALFGQVPCPFSGEVISQYHFYIKKCAMRTCRACSPEPAIIILHSLALLTMWFVFAPRNITFCLAGIRGCTGRRM
ncbi:hypothetical protein DSP73_21055 [Salmonella enterica]|nr:hypothetical protein [Salmonella enterica]ECN5820925.1 hypothetical protein [Salmonella enterica subsp. enterica serovar Infantis]EDW6859437.1 hypothetical protein [Salmonella enterica]EEJ5736126.1 hypothetical protein [Salmonella enterica]